MLSYKTALTIQKMIAQEKAVKAAINTAPNAASFAALTVLHSEATLSPKAARHFIRKMETNRPQQAAQVMSAAILDFNDPCFEGVL